MSELLLKIGWSKTYFAARMGVTPKTVHRWCKEGAPRYVMVYLEMVARFLGEKNDAF